MKHDEMIQAVPTLREVVSFLLGEGSLDGKWFGDEPPLTASGRKAPYWWRKNLRAAMQTIAADKLEVDEDKLRNFIKDFLTIWFFSRDFAKDGIETAPLAAKLVEELRPYLRQPTNTLSDLQAEWLLHDMRMQVVCSHVATMPIPLYERIKAALQPRTES